MRCGVHILLGEQQGTASSHEVIIMLKAIVVALLLSGLSAVPVLAGDMHSIADRYIQSDATIRDRDLAIAILCLVAGLPDQATAAAPLDDVEAAGKIQLLASKLIGNGAPQVATPPSKLAAVVIIPKPKPPTTMSNRQLGMAIACEVDRLLQAMQPGRAPAMKAAECPNAVGSKDAVIILANKIIGNG